MAKYSDLNLSQVQKLAATLAQTLAGKPAIIGLTGNLGSGKTTFAKALATALGIKTLKSPTFIVSQRYTLKKGFLYHMDFYRLTQKKDLEVLGLDEILSSGNLVLIEWVEKFPSIQKQCDLLINFKVKDNDKRDVTIQTN